MLGLCYCVRFSLVAASRGHSSCGARDSHCGGFSCGAWALGHTLTNCDARDVPWHVGFSWTSDRTLVSCIDRQILYHWTSREAPSNLFLFHSCSAMSCLSEDVNESNDSQFLFVDFSGFLCFLEFALSNCTGFWLWAKGFIDPRAEGGAPQLLVSSPCAQSYSRPQQVSLCSAWVLSSQFAAQCVWRGSVLQTMLLSMCLITGPLVTSTPLKVTPWLLSLDSSLCHEGMPPGSMPCSCPASSLDLYFECRKH